MQVVRREISRGLYSPLSYTASKLVLDGLVLRALPALLFTVPFYLLMGLQPAPARFFTFLFAFSAFNCTVGGAAPAAGPPCTCSALLAAQGSGGSRGSRPWPAGQAGELGGEGSGDAAPAGAVPSPPLP
jgi:hypothetical protein